MNLLSTLTYLFHLITDQIFSVQNVYYQCHYNFLPTKQIRADSEKGGFPSMKFNSSSSNKENIQEVDND